MDKRKKTYRRFKSLKKYLKENRGALWFAFLAGLLAAGILTKTLKDAQKAVPEAVKPTIPVVEAYETPCDFDAITYIRCRGEQLEMPNEDIMKMIRIARCESGFNQYAKNPNSTAKGIFQFIDGTWRSNCLKDGNVYNFVDNINCAWKVYQKQGSRPWNASKYCWNK